MQKQGVFGTWFEDDESDKTTEFIENDGNESEVHAHARTHTQSTEQTSAWTQDLEEGEARTGHSQNQGVEQQDAKVLRATCSADL